MYEAKTSFLNLLLNWEIGVHWQFCINIKK